MLAANEVEIDGFVRDTSNANQLVVTFSTAGATQQSGFLRDADGRLVVTS